MKNTLNGSHKINLKDRVLIADDDSPTRILLRAAISQWGYEIIEAKDGEEAWKILQTKDAPRLLILDWLMPKMDGLTLCQRARNELVDQPYIILLTQITGVSNIIKGLEAGADEFLSKPFNMAELRSRLSIGSKIINYKKMVEVQNKQFQNYITHVKTLAEKSLHIHTKIQSPLREELKEHLDAIISLSENLEAEFTDETSNV